MPAHTLSSKTSQFSIADFSQNSNGIKPKLFFIQLKTFLPFLDYCKLLRGRIVFLLYISYEESLEDPEKTFHVWENVGLRGKFGRARRFARQHAKQI